MNIVARHRATRIGAGAKTAARVNQAEELVMIPWHYQLCLEGRIFVAGSGVAETEINGESAIDETTPTFLLAAPVGGTIVIPLYFRAYLDTEGDSAPDSFVISYVQANKTASAVGTAMSPLNCMGGAAPRKHQALALHTVSAVSSTGDDETVMVRERTNMIDNIISVEGITTTPLVERFDTSSFELTWQPEMPLPLRYGSGIYFHAGTGSADSKFNYTMAWAELDEDTYKV